MNPIKKLTDESKRHTIYVGDCLLCLDEVVDKSCRLVFADPPYNMGKRFGTNLDKWNTPGEYRDWCELWIDKCINKLTEDGCIMIMGHPRYSAYLIPYLDSRLVYVNQLAFYYTDGMPERKNFERRYEIIMYYRKNSDNYIFNVEDVRVPLIRYDKTSNPRGKIPNDVWQIHRVRWNSRERVSLGNGKIAHAAQKPIRLMRRIILVTTNANDLVLDPFLGTGTTSVAAKELGRKSIGIEINPLYAEISLKRINQSIEFDRELSFEER